MNVDYAFCVCLSFSTFAQRRIKEKTLKLNTTFHVCLLTQFMQCIIYVFMAPKLDGTLKIFAPADSYENKFVFNTYFSKLYAEPIQTEQAEGKITHFRAD